MPLCIYDDWDEIMQYLYRQGYSPRNQVTWVPSADADDELLRCAVLETMQSADEIHFNLGHAIPGEPHNVAYLAAMEWDLIKNNRASLKAVIVYDPQPDIALPPDVIVVYRKRQRGRKPAAPFGTA